MNSLQENGPKPHFLKLLKDFDLSVCLFVKVFVVSLSYFIEVKHAKLRPSKYFFEKQKKDILGRFKDANKAMPG